MEKERKKSKFAGATTDLEKTDRVKAGGIIASASFLLGGIFQVVWMAYCQQTLGPKGMGLFMPMVGWFYVIGSVMALGLPQTICTFVSNHYETDAEEARRFLSDGNKLVLVLNLVIVAVSVVLAAAGKALGVINGLYFAMIVVMMVSCAAALSFWSVNSILNGYQRVDLVSVGNCVFPVGQLAGTVGFVILAQRWVRLHPGVGEEWLVVGAIAGMGVGQATGLAFALWLVVRNRMATMGELFDLRKNRGLFRKILTFGGIAAVAVLANAVVQNVTAPVARLVGLRFHIFTEAQIGYYTTALYYGMVPMLLIGVAIALLPAISEAEGQGRRDLMQKYYTGAMQQCFTTLAALFMIYALIIGKVALLMGGTQFPEGLMRELSLRMVVGGAGVAMVLIMTNLFIGLKRPGVPAVVATLVLIGQVGGIAFFSIVFRDILWATAGFALPPLLGCAVMFALAWKRFGLRFPWRALVEPSICAVPAWLAGAFALSRFVSSNASPVASIVVGAVTGVAVYAFLMWLFERGRKPAEVV